MILVTGGAGYIGSHLVSELFKLNKKVIVVDNFSNSTDVNLIKVSNYYNANIKTYKRNIQDEDGMHQIFKENKIESIFHLAGLKSIPDSFLYQEEYYANNVLGTKIIIELALKYRIKKFIFSSSASVYGNPKYLPIDEFHELKPLNPYAKNKLSAELILKQYEKENICIKVLRYFNPVGVDKKVGLIEEIKENSTNIVPALLKAASNYKSKFEIYGSDYETHDGTAIRDYIHISDLIDAHIKSLIDNQIGFFILNIGSGKGYTVLELVKAFENEYKLSLKKVFKDRRKGDIGKIFTSNEYANSIINWRPTRDLNLMMKDLNVQL